MSTELKIEEVSKPRFEFRTFGQDFSEAAYRMSRLSVPVPEEVWERQSAEIYILSRTNDINNTKIRDGKMDIKALLKEVDGFEQWKPMIKSDFPISKATLIDDVFPVFQVVMPELGQGKYSLDEFLGLL